MRKPDELILGVSLEIKFNFRRQGFSAAHVQGIWQAMDKESGKFAYFRQQFSKMRETKMKQGIIVGSQLEQLVEEHDFSTKLNATERRT
jgi:translation initiation factor IF-3